MRLPSCISGTGSSAPCLVSGIPAGSSGSRGLSPGHLAGVIAAAALALGLGQPPVAVEGFPVDRADALPQLLPVLAGDTLVGGLLVGALGHGKEGDRLELAVEGAEHRGDLLHLFRAESHRAAHRVIAPPFLAVR